MSGPTATAPVCLRIEITNRGHLRLLRGTRAIVLRSREKLERVGHQCLDFAVMLADAKRNADDDRR
jgi:hypothetical protein